MKPSGGTWRPGGVLPDRGGGAEPSPSKLSEAELIAGSLSAAPGDTRAFDELVRRHQDHILANCRFIVDDPEDAMDLAQEALVKAYFGLASFGGRSTFRTWLRRIKVNQCLSFLKSPRSRVHLSLNESMPEKDQTLQVPSLAQEAVEAIEVRERVVQILEGIPENLRIPLVLKDMDGFSYKEIQEMLNLGLSALKMRVSRGREAFRKAWGEGGERTG